MQGELVEGRELEFCAYVAGGFTNNVNGRLVDLGREAGVPASGITAQNLLELAKRQPGTKMQPTVRELFRSSGIIDHVKVADIWE